MDNRNPFDDPSIPEDFSDGVWSGEMLPLAGGPLEDDKAGLFETLVNSRAADAAIGPISSADGDHREVRLYVKHSEGWIARIKPDWLKEYCYSQNPGEEYYHLLISGEIYLQRGTEKYCLSCALRHGHVTLERLHWQRSGARPSDEK